MMNHETVCFVRSLCGKASPLSASLFLLLAGCATVPLQEGGSLSSYSNLKQSDGVLTKTKYSVDKRAVLAAKSVRIIPTVVASSAARSGLIRQQLALVSNAIDRAVCRHLSARLQVVTPDQSADLSAHAVITFIEKTETTAAGISTAVAIGSSVASAATGAPIPSLRLPFGLGGLAVEGQASGARGEQAAAIVWARGADAFTTRARVAEEGDAYTLAKSFAEDFANLIITGSDPISDPMPMLPSAEGVGEFFGGKPKYAACELFGKHPGFGDAIAGAIGLPPEWSDDGGRAAGDAKSIRP